MRFKLSFIHTFVLTILFTLNNEISFAETNGDGSKEGRVRDEPRRNAISIATWIPPRDITKKFPYYLSGYDSESRPVYIVEMGRWDVRSVVEKGGKDLENLKLHFQQLYYRIGQGGRFSASEENFDVPSVVIVDWGDYSLQQLASSKTVQALIENMADFKTIEDSIAYGYFINVNDAAETLISFARPRMGKFMNQIQTFGIQRDQWIPKLLANIPRSQLPAWYGGNPNFRAVAIYG